MPELPDLTVYCESIVRVAGGLSVEAIELPGPFLLRTVEPPPGAATGRKLRGCSLLGKRLVLELEGDLFLVVHLMVAGRLHWRAKPAKPGARVAMAIDFGVGSLTLTEAGSRKRASLHIVAGRSALASMDPGGVDVLAGDFETFRRALTRENHTLKRALTDPRIISGIGNAYSDEILHAAGLSPIKHTDALSTDELIVLFRACREQLANWTSRLRLEVAGGFPQRVTAFRDGMAVHGRYRQPCPRCGQPVQRIVYASNESNYCAGCQTGGKLLADRALSRL